MKKKSKNFFIEIYLKRVFFEAILNKNHQINSI